MDAEESPLPSGLASGHSDNILRLAGFFISTRFMPPLITSGGVWTNSMNVPRVIRGCFEKIVGSVEASFEKASFKVSDEV